MTTRLDRLEKRLDEQESATAHWRKRWQMVDEKLTEANGKISRLEAEVERKNKVIEKKDAQITRLKRTVFGESSEISEPLAEELFEEPAPKRNRGKQPGSKGFGRTTRNELRMVEREHDVPDHEKTCGTCGEHLEPLPFSEDSEEIDYTVEVVRVKHKRLKYRKTCRCKSTPAIVTAPKPVKLIPKGLLSVNVWTHILLEKFCLVRPITRVCKSLSLQGLRISDGTIASGLKRLTKLFAVLYNKIREESRRATHWHMDETHARVFTDSMGKPNHKWWLWVTSSEKVTFFTLDPSRSSKVPLKHLEGIEVGIVSCDRYSGYKPLLDQGLELAFCWSHVKRDFIAILDGFPKLKQFASEWISRIDSLFHYNKSRSESSFAEQEVHSICELMERDAKKLVARKDTHEEVRNVLTSLLKHWKGLTIFLKHPKIPMDNNEAERAVREFVLLRKISLGNHSIWGGHLGAIMCSVFATLQKNGINADEFIRNYLTACAENNGQPPPNIENFLPWVKSAEKPVLALTMVH